MNWQGIIIEGVPLVALIVLLFWLFRKMLVRKPPEVGTLKKFILIALIIVVLGILAKIIYSYFVLKGSPLGPYLLKDRNFIIQYIFALILPNLSGAVFGAILYFIGLILSKKVSRPLFEKTDLLIIFLACFVVGFPNLVVMLMGSFILMALLLIIIRKPEKRLGLSPFVLASATVILVLSNFSFYSSFLSFLRLT